MGPIGQVKEKNFKQTVIDGLETFQIVTNPATSKTNGLVENLNGFDLTDWAG